jgi:hypothetical protein
MKSDRNIDHARDEDKLTECENLSEGEEVPGSYYYDDATGYEVFQDDDEESEASEGSRHLT